MEDKKEEMENAQPSRAEMLYEERQREEALKQEFHEENMKNDINYKRGYYQRQLEVAFKMIPKENYYKDEYEGMVELYNKYFDKMNTLTEDKDFLDLIEKYKKKTKRVFNANAVAVAVLLCFIVAIGIFIIYCIKAK